MTRDPSRIDPILARLRAAWQRSPDLRLGQLIVGSIPIGHLDRADAIRRLFNAECHEFGASGALVEWPAPSTASQPPPVLDLDALAEAERAMTAGTWRANIFTTHVAYSTQETQWHEAVAGSDVVCETECSAFEDETAIGAANIRGIVALRNAAPHLIAEARAAVVLRQELAAMSEKLAEAKRLGLKACDQARLDADDAIRAALEAL